ncbi:MAG: ABC transporter substrate-binding protein [Proteobacteria bacterium]|nr:ABC transporter substrate-binding protein [Pseudomonadota bacterium]
MVGILRASTPMQSDPRLGGWIYRALRDLGYTEGQDLRFEERHADDQVERIPALAHELAQLKPDVIISIGTTPAQALRAETSTIPIVFLTNVDPIALGMVSSLARPGGNVTGVLIAPEGTLAGKKLELLKELVPRATRFALLVPDDPGAGLKLQVQEARQAASIVGVELVVVAVRGGDYGRAFAAIRAAQPGGLVVGGHVFFLRDRKQIIDLAARDRLPAIYEWPSQVKDGGLMSYGADDGETYQRLASYVDQICKGARAGDLPIWRPSVLHLVINLKAARALGLTIPASLLERVDDVIQ